MEEQKTGIRHKPVLVNEVIEYLDPQPGKTYLDVTFGSGGHTRAILEHEPKCRVIAMDWDLETLERFGDEMKAEFGDRLKLVWGNFALLYKILKKEGIHKVDGVLADFGTSQVQIAERAGLSIFRDMPLDMRMSPAHQRLTAEEVLRTSSEEKLRQIFWQLGEDNRGRAIAREIMVERKKRRIKTTKQLADLIERVVGPQKRGIHPATKVFQALRIFVNKELDNITSFLNEATRVLAPGGNIVCISFHSLEDRLVKQFFRDASMRLVLEVLTPKVVVAGEEEVSENPSSRSARLRAAKRA